MAHIKLRKGYDIPLAGVCDTSVADAPAPDRVGICPPEFGGLKPRPLVEEGTRVKIGSPLFHVKNHEDYVFAAPASGVVRGVNRGARRKLLDFTIEPDGQDAAETFEIYDAGRLASLAPDTARRHAMATGALFHFRQRPFNHLPRPDAVPRDIFISTFDTAPLAPSLAPLVAGERATWFQAGLDVCTRLTSGHVYLSLDGRPGAAIPDAFRNAKNVQLNSFAGRHPAGCVGVQIHHLAPICGRQDIVWTISVQGVVELGRLFVTGRHGTERLVGLAGSEVTQPQYLRTVTGARVGSLTEGRVKSGELRYISGDVLTGRNVGADGYVGFQDHLVTVIPEVTEPEFIGWMLPGLNKPSWSRLFASTIFAGKRFTQNTRMNGGHRAFVVSGWYERVTPMDIYPTHLVKSIIAEDFEEMEGLGIYEVVEEDLALCEYICPSKQEVQSILREGLELVHKEG